MSADSDTKRTDTLFAEFGRPEDASHFLLDHARTLERELSAEREKVAKLTADHAEKLQHALYAENKVRELMANIAKLESDKRELVVDAERYRQLRDAPNDYPHPFIAMRNPISVVSQLTGEAADFATDQAISAKHKEPK